MKYGLVLCCTSVIMLSSLAVAAGPDDGDSQDALLLGQIKKHPGLRSGGIGLIRQSDGVGVLAAVGVADLASTDPVARERAEKEAELDARVKIAGFVGGEQITAMTRSSLQLAPNSGLSDPGLKETYEEKVSGVVDTRIVGVRLLGTYPSSDTRRLHAVVILDEQILRAAPAMQDGFPLFPRVVIMSGVAPVTGDPRHDLETALRDALLRAQWSAGGASVYSVRQRGSNQPFRMFDQVQANGWVDSFEVIAERRKSGEHRVVIQAVVVADPSGTGVRPATNNQLKRPETRPARNETASRREALKGSKSDESGLLAHRLVGKFMSPRGGSGRQR